MKHIKKFNEEFIIEDGGGASGGASGSGDSSGGVAYATKGGGMGPVQNATVSDTPGDPSGSISGSGDVGFVLPNNTYTNNTGITGNAYVKLASTKLYDTPNSKRKNFSQSVNKIKDKLGIGKTMTFQSFINSQ